MVHLSRSHRNSIQVGNGYQIALFECRHLEPPSHNFRINNGGIGFRGLGEETEIEIDQMVMNVDYFSGVVLTKSLLPDAWRSVGEGSTVNSRTGLDTWDFSNDMIEGCG